MIHGRLIARAAVGLAAALAATTSAAQAAPPGLNGRIAYATSDIAINTVESDGTRGKTAFDRHTGGEGAPWSTLKLRAPVTSPDGRKLAFAGAFTCDGCQLETSRIGVIDADGHQGQPLVVANAAGPAAPVRGLANPAWSADGKTIVLEGFDGASGLFTVPATGGTLTKVSIPAAFEDPREPTFSPDGRLLAFSAEDAQNDRRVYVKNLENEQVTQLTTGGAHQGFPAFSPDSATVAYVNTPLAPGGGFGYAELAVRPLGGGAPDILWSNQVEQGRFVKGRPSFSPDGKHVVFSATRMGDPQGCAGDVMVVNTEGAASPRSIGCGGTTEVGSVDWGLRTAKGSTRLVSAIPGSDRESADASTADLQVAPGGRYADFSSAGTNLAAGVNDDNGKLDVFHRDLTTGETELVSADEDGGVPEGDSDLPFASADGQFVVFRSTARNVLAGFEGGATAVYRRDTLNNKTTLVSRFLRHATTGPSGDSRPLAISDTGRYVLFSSTGNDLLADQAEPFGDMDTDLFVWDDLLGQTTLVTAKVGGGASTGRPGRAFLSDDGRRVAFESTGTDLVPGFVDHNEGDASIFVADLDAKTTTLVDGALGSATDTSGDAGELQGIDADGEIVLFRSAASDVVDDFVDGNGAAPDVYVRRLVVPKAFLITGSSSTPTVAKLAADGSRVAFTAADQVWSRTLDNGAPTQPAVLVTRGSDPASGANGVSTLVDVSATGAYVLLQSDATDLTAPLRHHDELPSLYRVATSNWDAEPISALGDDANDKPIASESMSRDGEWIAYTSASTNLLASFQDGNGADGSDAYAWLARAAAESDPIAPTVTITTPEDDRLYREGDVVLADYECADEGPSGLKRCEGTVPSGQPIDTSTTGSFTFEVVATDNAGNEKRDTVDYRVAAPNKKAALASRAWSKAGDNLTSGNGSSHYPVYSADGRYLVFTSSATNLVESFIDANEHEDDVFRRDLVTGAVEVVSAGLPHASDDGRPRGANREAQTEPTANAVSADGRYVLFASEATDLVAGQDFPAGEQLYVRDMQTKTTKLVSHRETGLSGGDAEPHGYRFSRDGSTVVFSADAPALVPNDTNGASDVFAYSMATGAVTLVSVEHTGQFPGSGSSYVAAVSDNGRRVLFRSSARNLLPGEPLDSNVTHVYWRDLDTGTTKLVDHRWDDPSKPAGRDTSGEPQLSGDGRIVLFGGRAGDVIDGYAGHESELRQDQLFLRDVTTTGPAALVTNGANAAKTGTGGDLENARLSRDGKTVLWTSYSGTVIEDFVDQNDLPHTSPEPDLFTRRFDGATPAGPAALATYDLKPNHGVRFPIQIRGLSDDARFVVAFIPTRQCDCERRTDDLRRLDIKRNKFTDVITAADDDLELFAASADAKRIAVMTEAENILPGFRDGNARNSTDVFTWYDAPPVVVADARVTGSLKLEFDGSDSTDSDGTVDYYDWSFGDGQTGSGEVVEHTYPDEDNYPVKLTIEDDAGNEVVHTFEVVAIKGVLTTGAEPIDFIGIDKHLRCSIRRGIPLLAQGGGACGTFVAVGGKTYGPPELIDGVETYTPVSQERTEDGDVATLVTTVALGDSGVRVKQTDRYQAGKAFYRTDVELLNAGDAAQAATVYVAARCAIGEETGRRSLHDAGTSMAGCDGAHDGRTLAAWLPLSPNARRDSASATAVFGRIAAGQPLADTCACGSQPDPGTAIGWGVEVPGKGQARVGSLAAFGPDGSIPLTLALKADKGEVQPLDENAFTVTLRNPNAGERPVDTLLVEHEAAWDPTPGTTTGMTTADPTVNGDTASWKDLKVAGHGTGELRFGVTHRSGQRVAVTQVTPRGGDFADLASTSLADLVPAKASVTARQNDGAKPNTAITSGPTGMTTSRDPAFKLEASKELVTYECRFGDAAWAPCEGNPHTPGPLADGPYVLEARAVDAIGADETPAKRTFVVDTAPPSTSISSGPKGTINDNRPGFFFGSSEAGARFECRLEGPGRSGAWFACEAPTYRPSALADGEWTFAVKAIDAAGNEDASPATLQFAIDTTPPVTVIDGVTRKVLGAARTGAGASASGGSGSTVALGADGSAGVNVSCPQTGPACNGAVGLATQPASAAQARPGVPSNAVTLARAEFSAQPGETVSVRLPLTMTVRNTVERVARMAVFTTIDTGNGRPVRGSDVVLTPDPRTARLLDAGREVSVKGGKVKLRLACRSACKGTVKLATGKAVKFNVKRRGAVLIPVSKTTKRGKELSVRINTRLAPSKRLTLTLRAQEARR
ncbi:PKD domain-containing protein [Solirubrobacter phytolaccae]|uniref:PKD domain-containing protein n=1 Tax=Solirubrobacter phytolaccae TaxID=1404360 RepID=A0A9X3S9D1_9ACTN|nr:PKD domain-containing protein [Solirubrobacter phytolaccae]MDA0183289.1 PKD domain-containing protein [Solirubrobacter phytolaccae]